MTLPIDIDREAIVAFCKANSISKLAFFGSVLTERFAPDSDVDVIVEFLPSKSPTLLDMARLERELSDLFEHTVDLRTPEDLSRYFRDEVVRTAYVQYAA